MTSTQRGRETPTEQRPDGRRRRRSRPTRPPRDWDREEEPLPPTDPDVPSVNISELDATPRDELIDVANDFEVENADGLPRQELIYRILQKQALKNGSIFSGGILNVVDDGFGFLRGERLRPGPNDVYVSQSQVRRFGLRSGDYVSGQVRQPKDSEKYYGLRRVETVNGLDPEAAKRRAEFDSLTAVFANEMLRLFGSGPPNTQKEGTFVIEEELSQRMVDLVSPIGRGQRGLIVSPPKAGKTLLLKSIAHGITNNYPDIHLMILLIGERPEEVTDMKRSVTGEVIASTFDDPAEDHTRVTEAALERAKRLVEGGTDVVILMDSITRLTRAYNTAMPTSGRTLSGGVDPIALYPSKRFFGAARNIEEGGSLTIIATCLIETGSRMDDVIFEEFKGTGNMELRLVRKLAEKRMYPAIDVVGSSTRRDDLLYEEEELQQVWLMRRMAAWIEGDGGSMAEIMINQLPKTPSNEEFLASMKSMAQAQIQD